MADTANAATIAAELESMKTTFADYKKVAEAQLEKYGVTAKEHEDKFIELAEKMDKKENELAELKSQLDKVSLKSDTNGLLDGGTTATKYDGHMGEYIKGALSHQTMVSGKGFKADRELGNKFASYLDTKAAAGLNEMIGDEGGYLLNEDDLGVDLTSRMLGGEIISRVTQRPIGPGANGAIIRMLDETSLAAGSLSGGITAYWVNEAETITASKPSFRKQQRHLRKIAALINITNEEMEDVTYLESWLSQEVPKVLQFELEQAIYSGTGASEPLGILNSGAKVTVAKEAGQAADTVVAENIINMYARTVPQNRANYVWLYNQNTFPQLATMTLAVGTGGVPVWMPGNNIAGTPYNTLMGLPAIPSYFCETLGDEGDIMLVDLSQYLLIGKGGVKTAMSPHLYFTTDQNSIRFTLRVDGAPLWESPLTPRNSSDDLSPIITLAARA